MDLLPKEMIRHILLYRRDFIMRENRLVKINKVKILDKFEKKLNIDFIENLPYFEYDDGLENMSLYVEIPINDEKYMQIHKFVIRYKNNVLQIRDLIVRAWIFESPKNMILSFVVK